MYFLGYSIVMFLFVEKDMILWGDFYGLEIWHGIFGGLNFGPGTFFGFCLKPKVFWGF